MVKIAIVAGETSGDNLGAGLIRELKLRLPDVQFEGIGGPAMQAEGMQSYFPMHKISIMGLDGLVRHLHEILGIRRKLIQLFLNSPPDLFVGIDVPDFNLGLELKLRTSGIRTLHYVSPTVWAWRSYRIHKIRKAVGHMLTLFPFEADFYRDHNVPVTCVGHPIADQVSREKVEPLLDSSGKPIVHPVIALLPGSRRSEIERLGPVFTQVALRLIQQFNVHIVVPCANERVRPVLHETILKHLPEDRCTAIDGNARIALRGAKVALLASGTAALEAALVGTPMVVAYKVSLASFVMVKVFSKVKHYSMPNHLLEQAPVPEFIQQQATADNLFNGVKYFLQNESERLALREKLLGIQTSLQLNADISAAQAVLTELELP
ncbi:MAG: lipid-A-disaccharide synthase [Parasphingorhabdus sp.]